MITFNFDESTATAGYDEDNYENLDHTIDEEEAEEIHEHEEGDDGLAHDDSDSGIDSLYECIKFRNSEQLEPQNKGEYFISSFLNPAQIIIAFSKMNRLNY